MASGKSLTKEENEQLRLMLRQLVAKHGSQKAVAEAIPASQQMVSYVLNGGDAGVYFATSVARFLGYPSYPELLGKNVPLYGDSPSWRENEPEAQRQHPLPPAAYKLARETPAYVKREPFTPGSIVATVLWRWANATDDEKIQADTTRVRKDMSHDNERRRFQKKGLPSEPKLPPAKRTT